MPDFPKLSFFLLNNNATLNLKYINYEATIILVWNYMTSEGICHQRYGSMNEGWTEAQWKESIPQLKQEKHLYNERIKEKSPCPYFAARCAKWHAQPTPHIFTPFHFFFGSFRTSVCLPIIAQALSEIKAT